MLNNITNNVKSTSKTHLLTIEINRNSLLALEDHLIKLIAHNFLISKFN